MKPEMNRSRVPHPDEAQPRRFLVCYDIGNDTRRAAVARVLSGFGTRVQFSIFECSLSPRELRRLVRALAGVVDAESDDLRIHALSESPAASRPVDVAAAFWLV